MAVWLSTHLRRISLQTNAVRRITQSVLKHTGHPSAILSVTFVGHVRIRTLNRQYRQHDRPTDVLAFPGGASQEIPNIFLGDVVICLPIAITQASSFGNTPDAEILRLIIHGTLHLLGYDHEVSQGEAKRMQKKEQDIFQRLTPVPRLLN